MNKTGIYIHIPFCVRKCAYCDFVSYPADAKEVGAYFRALMGIELANAIEFIKSRGRSVETIYIGGGTPTSVDRRHLTSLVRVCMNELPYAGNIEITVEMNPGTVDKEYIRALIMAGVSRFSIGVQSFNDETLRFLGRIHSADEARRSIRMARGAGCSNLSLDLIYGTPGESLAGLLHSVEKAVSLNPEHLSVYGLSIPEGTRLYSNLQAGTFEQTSPEVQREMYEALRETLAMAGYAQYEISSWARPGFECRHNLNYWRLGEYLGLGCAASSFIDNVRRKNIDDHREYVRRLEGMESPIAEQESLSSEQRIEETVMLGLRMREGICLKSLSEREGYDLLTEKRETIDRLLHANLIKIESGYLRLTDEGILVADEVILWLA